MIRLVVSLLLLMVINPIFAQLAAPGQPNIIPRPVKLSVTQGNFIIDSHTVIVVKEEGEKPSADFLNGYLKEIYGFSLQTVKEADKNFILLNTRKFIQAPENEERYTLRSSPESVNIEGDSYAGTFYGIQTLLQLLPVEKSSALLVPAVDIEDQPRFKYRGLHLDVGRHFFPVSFVKKYIDYIALHKMNYFHWHLTDDQGWRIEIKKYPRLTEIGAYRNGTIIGRYPGTGNDSIHYGGFYTQDEIKEVIAYAAKRYITILPEIEMPGHAVAALTAYPELGCTGGPYQVKQTWGVFQEVFCAGNDTVFNFLEDVLDEVMALFPSPYIHVGGDECPKDSWKTCVKCQKRIKDNHLKDEHELQSYFIQRIEKYVNSKGRKIIGWDEILEGGLAPNAAVMSWRGEKGGIEAAKQNHQVIMTPGSHVYFDHSQSRNEDSVTIGGYISIQKTYSYEPVPAELDAEQQKKIWGAQANVWSEYMQYPVKVEYQIFPRLSALSEVLWSPRELRDWNDFEKRLLTQFRRYELWGANYSKAYYDLKTSILPANDGHGVVWALDSAKDGGQIKYTTNPAAKKLLSYNSPIPVTKDETLGATLVINGQPTSWAWQKFNINKATGKKISLATPPSPAYPGNGQATGLVNGARSAKGINSSEWQGWKTNSMETVIDLGKSTPISEITIHVLDHNGAQIYFPEKAEAFISADGKTFKPVASTEVVTKEISGMGYMNMNFTSKKTRYIKLVVNNHGRIAKGSAGAGNMAWLFIDEIQVN